jgi:hypothetical protein
MSDTLIEEIYAFVRDALAAGEPSVPVHIFPFHMTAENMRRHADNAAHETWRPLKQAYDDFAETRQPPKIGMCSKRYVVNSIASVGMDPNASCPTLIGKRLAPLSPRLAKRLAKSDPDFVADGKKLKSEEASSGLGSFFSGSMFAWGTETTPAAGPQQAKSSVRKDAELGAVQPLLGR